MHIKRVGNRLRLLYHVRCCNIMYNIRTCGELIFINIITEIRLRLHADVSALFIPVYLLLRECMHAVLITFINLSECF